MYHANYVLCVFFLIKCFHQTHPVNINLRKFSSPLMGPNLAYFKTIKKGINYNLHKFHGSQLHFIFVKGKGNHILTWPMWFNIILGVAFGLWYLQENQPRFIHQDIKASNILLDQNLQAKNANFDLAFLFSNDKTHISMIEIVSTKWVWILQHLKCGF